MPKPLTSEEILNQAKKADSTEKAKLLKLKACPLSLIEQYAFPKFDKKYYLREPRHRIIARAREEITTKVIKDYISLIIKNNSNPNMFPTLLEFFDNPNFSLDIFTDLLNEKGFSKEHYRKVLVLASRYKNTTVELLNLAVLDRGLYQTIAKHPNISNEIARKIISNSYAETLLSAEEAEKILNSLGNDLKSYDDGYALWLLKNDYREIRMNLIRNYNLSVEVLVELIPTQEMLDNRQAGIPEALRGLLRVLPPGEDRERVANILYNLKQAKVHPMTTKLIAKSTNNKELLTKLVYGADIELSNLAATNPAVKREDKIAFALMGKQRKVKKIKTRF